MRREDEKESGQTGNEVLTKARAIFDEHGRRDMEAALLEAFLEHQEESKRWAMVEVKKESEQELIDKDCTQIAIQSSIREAEEQEKKRMNDAIIASIAEKLNSLPKSVRLVMAQGYTYDDAMEAYQVMGDNADFMLSYLLERRN